MGEELLSLKWNNHQAHFVDILTFLREQEIFIDATLACGGKLYPAHKFVLSTCSEYFKQMFTKNPNKHPIVFLKDVTCKDLEALLDFMYNGEVNVPQSSLGSLIKTAEGLQIKGLAVPDDPPAAMKRDRNLNKENKESRFKRERSFSPPVTKRLKETNRSPIRNSSASTFSNSSIRHRSPSLSSNRLSVVPGLSNLETIIDEDSRTSANSGVSEQSQSMIAKPNTNNHDDNTSLSDNMNEPSPGTSGMHKSIQSKEEEMEIKQEDMGLGDLGPENEEWRDGDDNLDDGSRESSLPSVNVSNFADSLLPPSENAGERAMWVTAPSGSRTLGRLGLNLLDKLTTSEADRLSRLSIFSDMQQWLDGNAPSSTELEANRPAVSLLTGDELWNCSLCRKMFVSKYYFQRHMKCHLTKREMCPYCPFRSTYKWNLKSHIRNKHKDKIPFYHGM